MQITVQFFAHLGDIAGIRERTMTVGGRATVADVEACLSTEDARFADSFAHCRIAVNNEWATANMALSDGDEVSFMPPVSGG